MAVIFTHYNQRHFSLNFEQWMEMTINLEAVSTAAEAARTNGKNWVAVGVGLTASTESWVKPGSLCICVNN